MSIWEEFRTEPRKILGRIRTLCGCEPETNPSAVRREILDQLMSEVVVSENGKRLPFGRIVVRLQPKTAKQHASFEEAFVLDSALSNHLLQSLKGMQVQYPRELQVRVELGEASNVGDSGPLPAFEIDYVKPNVLRLEEVPEIRLDVTRGAAERQSYHLKKDRVLIGRPAEVLDWEGRIVRKNDIVFVESEDEVAASVGSAHARIWYDYEKRGFLIMDEGSRYGTRIRRQGALLEIPDDDPAGVQLQSGDDLYFGQAGLHFELV